MNKETIGVATLYCGDCEEILPTLEKVDLILTDPPYGIKRDGKPKSTSSHGGHKGYAFKEWDHGAPPKEVFDLMHDKAETLIIWGGNYFPQSLRPSMRWLVWDKGQRISQSDCELAYTNMQKALRSITINRASIRSDGAVHPTQKPVALMTWCISMAQKNVTSICDPFMGSGTTGVAATNLDIRFVGIERDPEYFDMSCERIRKASDQLRLDL
jgi:DNA modification methylase